MERLRAEKLADNVSAQQADPLAGIRNSSFIGGERYRDQQIRANRSGAHPDIIRFEAAFIRALARVYVPAFAHNMVRDDAHQNALYVQGVSRAKAGKSPHNYGLAVDVVHSTKAWDMTKEQWAVFGHVGKEVAKRLIIPIIWGGDWVSFWDPAHWELDKWKTLKNWQAEANAKELAERKAYPDQGSLF